MSTTSYARLLPLVLLAACSFGASTTVDLLSYPAAPGVLETDAAGDYVYIGLNDGGSRWSPKTTIQVYDAAGVKVRRKAAVTGAWAFVAVAVDPRDDTVWTLHEGGHLTQWSAGMARPLAFHSNAFAGQVPSTGDVIFCDLDIAPNGTMLTTVMSDSFGSWSNHVVSRREYISGGTGIRVYREGSVSTNPDPAIPRASCGHVSISGTEVALLLPDHASASNDWVHLPDIVTESDRSGRTYYRLDWNPFGVSPTPTLELTPYDKTKFGFVDIARNPTGFAIVESSLYGSSTSEVSLYTESLGFQDDMVWRDIRSVEAASWVHPTTGDQLWWAGREPIVSSPYTPDAIGTVEIY